LGIGFSYLLSDLGIRLYRMNEERVALHKEPRRTCSGKIHYSPPPPPPLSLAEDRETAGE
jgi:hypothetical protein